MDVETLRMDGPQELKLKSLEMMQRRSLRNDGDASFISGEIQSRPCNVDFRLQDLMRQLDLGVSHIDVGCI